MNRDGLVTFQEWQEYLYQQQLAEKQAAQQGQRGKPNAAVRFLTSILAQLPCA